MCRPVRNAAREGLHPGAGQKALLNRTPLAAILSNAGVDTIFEPYAEACGNDTSSLMQIRMFGRSSAAKSDEEKRDKNKAATAVFMYATFLLSSKVIQGAWLVTMTLRPLLRNWLKKHMLSGFRDFR